RCHKRAYSRSVDNSAYRVPPLGGVLIAERTKPPPEGGSQNESSNRAKLALVGNGSDLKKRRRLPWVVGTLMAVSFTLLIVLQSSNLWKELTIDTSSDLILLYALSSLNFVAFCVFAFVFLRSIIRLIRERRTFQMGAQIKTKLLIYFFAVSLMPIIAMAVFSYLFMNRALDRWFSQIPQSIIQQARNAEPSSAINQSLAELDRL